MAKFLKITSIIILALSVIVSSLFVAYLVITKDAKLNKNKLANPNQYIVIYDNEGNEIINASVSSKHKNVNIENLNKDCINAFIASEDRTFFKHNGLNYKRMFKALYKNVVSGSFKEGASTISQQLIKNTHLSQDKTIKRKLDEIRLTKQLEREYTKNEILEMYLNTIYFGHNCYGLQSAAEFYFDKKAEDLNLTESATLVGLLTSPNNFSPFKYPDKSLKKRNIVLESMLECGFIDKNTCETAKNSPLITKKQQSTGKNGDYINAVFDELEELDINAYDVADGCIIETYLDTNLQSLIENFNFETDNSIIITTKDSEVSAYKSTINGAKRQPGSTIKPLFVYAPAIEERILNPFTRILDEKINFNGYSPENFDKKYHGFVTVTESLQNSYNIPAVKTLNSLTVKTAEKYLTRMNIKLEDDEKNLALALGGMKHGLTLKDLTERYGIFQNGGVYSPSRFIKKISTKDGKKLYIAENSENRVFSEGVCSLMNEMLLKTAKDGTAKKLSSLKYDVAAKTGTCGNEEGNTDAYAVSYTSEHCVGVWLGDKNNQKLKITGGGSCCGYVKEIYNYLYSSHHPDKLEVNSETTQIEIDAEEYFKNNKIVLADDMSPKLNKLIVKVLKGNEPTTQSTRFSSPIIKNPKIMVENNTVIIQLCQTKYYDYIVKRYINDKYEVIYDGNWIEMIKDNPDCGNYVYTVTPYFLNGKEKIYGKEIHLPPININKDNTSPQIKIPDIAGKDWFNL
ncbi:MAG: transglycosylase domain-containing protein [Clostridia bacterium]|nr:transglycosylase domain-containing protein [Clostridia bacterium]